MLNSNTSSRMTSSIITKQRQKYKIIFLGDQSVGKTCIIERFMYDVFTENTHATVGVDFLAKTLHIEDKNVRLQLWDTAGQERFRSLIPSYIRDASCALLVFDVTKQATFDSLNSWLKEFRDNRGTDAPCFLVANKVDLSENRVITQEQIQEICQSEGLGFFEISAKTGHNIEEMFKNVAFLLLPTENNSIVNGTKLQALQGVMSGQKSPLENVLDKDVLQTNPQIQETPSKPKNIPPQIQKQQQQENNIKLASQKEKTEIKKDGGCC